MKNKDTTPRTQCVCYLWDIAGSLGKRAERQHNKGANMCLTKHNERQLQFAIATAIEEVAQELRSQAVKCMESHYKLSE